MRLINLIFNSFILWILDNFLLNAMDPECRVEEIKNRTVRIKTMIFVLFFARWKIIIFKYTFPDNHMKSLGQHNLPYSLLSAAFPIIRTASYLYPSHTFHFLIFSRQADYKLNAFDHPYRISHIFKVCNNIFALSWWHF